MPLHKKTSPQYGPSHSSPQYGPVLVLIQLELHIRKPWYDVWQHVIERVGLPPQLREEQLGQATDPFLFVRDPQRDIGDVPLGIGNNNIN